MPTLDATSRLAIAELIIYILYIPTTVFILYKHGKRGILGWSFFLLFCILRITSSSFQISDGFKQTRGEHVSATGSILNSIGVSPLLMSLSGILSEAAFYCDIKRELNIVLDVFFHFIIVSGIVIAAIGSSNLANPESPKNSYSSDAALLKAGYLLLLLTVLILAVYAVVIRMKLQQTRPAQEQTTERKHGIGNIKATMLVYWTMAAILFTAVRVVYGVVYAFSSNRQSLSPATAGFAIKFLLVFGVQFVAASCLVLGGVLSSGN